MCTENNVYSAAVRWTVFFFLIYLIYFHFWLCWVFAAACGLSLVAVSGGYSSLGSQASHCGGFFCYRAQALGSWAQQLWFMGFRMRAQYWATWAQLLCGMWNLPGPGVKPMSPALPGGFLSTVPTGKSAWSVIQISVMSIWCMNCSSSPIFPFNFVSE